MKNNPYSIAVFAFFLVACGEGAKENSSTDKNDNTTPLISLGDIVGITKTYEGGDDLFRISVESGKLYNVEIFDVDSNVATESGHACRTNSNYSGLALLIRDEKHSQIAASCSEGPSGNVLNSILFKSTSDGVYEVEVFSNNSNTKEVGNYKIRALPKHDDPLANWDINHEPNSSAINAYALEVGLGNSIESDIELRSNGTLVADIDWYRFEALKGVVYTVELFDVASNIVSETGHACQTNSNYPGLALLIQDSNFTNVKGSCSGGASGNVHHSLIFTAATSGAYYVKVYPNFAKSTESGKYSIIIK